MTEFLPKFGKPRMILLFGFVFLVISAFLPGATRAFVGGPPSSGDWIVTGTESYSDQTIVLDGNLIIESGGNLTFRRVNLRLNCSYDGQYGIEVRPSGGFYILEDSVIISVTSEFEFWFFVNQDSVFRMSDSELHECGWDHAGVDRKPTGLNVFSDDAVIENSLMSHNFYNIHILSSGVVMRNNNITASEQGIKVDTGVDNAIIHGNNISSNGLGIALDECNITISSNTITSNNMGIWSGGSKSVIRDNLVTNNTCGIDLSSSGAMIFNNTIVGNLEVGVESHDYDNSVISENIITSNPLFGIHCSGDSSPIIQNNTIAGSGYGIGCENSSSTIQDNTVSLNQNGIGVWNAHATLILHNNIFSNNANGIHVIAAVAAIQQNNVTANGWGIVLDHSNSSIQGNMITTNNEGGIMANFDCNPLIEGNYIENIGSGIVFKPNCTGIIQNNVITENSRGVELHEHCSPIIQGNRVTNNYFEGILLEHYCDPTIQGNILEHNGVGVSLQQYCSPTIQGNIIDHNTGDFGIICADNSNPEIHENDIYSNTGYGLANHDDSIAIDANENYWGSPTGPVQNAPDSTDPEETLGNIIYNPWLTEPILIVEITNPLSDETVSATVTVSANVKARNDVQRVEFYIDGLRYTDFDSPYEWSWDTTQYAETYQTITILAYDMFGLETKVSRTVFVDNTSPTVLFKEPQSGITYYGMVTIGVNATDNKEVGSVRVKADDGAWLIMTYNATSFLWEGDFNTTTLSDGQHTLMGLALDRAGNPTTTSTTVLTDNSPPSLTVQHPQTGVTVGLTLTVMVQASDMSGISKIEFYLANTLVNTLTTVPYQWAWDTTKYPNGAYTIRVEAYDTIGNVKSRDVTVTVNNVEVPWLQANWLTIVQVAIGLGGLTVAIVTFWSRTRDKKKKTTRNKETATNVPSQENSDQEEAD